MYGLKNPFGLRDGILYMIEDMTEEERGSKCNCICPSCEGRFIARLKDDNRRKHFAHDGEACDEVKAYLTGLYLLFQEYLKQNNPLLLPAVGFWFPLEKEVSENQIHFIEDYDTSRLCHIELTKGISLTFDQIDIIKDAKGYPEALLTKKAGHRLAIVIKPPDTVCKDFTVKPYGNISTVAVILDDSEWIHSVTKREMFDAIQNKEVRIRWIFNASWKTKLNEIEQRRAKYQAIKEQERIEKEQKEKERKERERLENERKEQERLEAERKEQERLESERRKREQEDQERKEQERLERERNIQLYREHQRQKQEEREKARIERENARLEHEKACLEREREKEEQTRMAKAFLAREWQLKPEDVSQDAHRQIDIRLPSVSIIELLNQQNVIAIDQSGKRWKRCEKCRNYGPVDQYFTDYESPTGQNLGLCKECAENNNNV
jgi:hypothetical protein